MQELAELLAADPNALAAKQSPKVRGITAAAALDGSVNGASGGATSLPEVQVLPWQLPQQALSNAAHKSSR